MLANIFIDSLKARVNWFHSNQWATAKRDNVKQEKNKTLINMTTD